VVSKLEGGLDYEKYGYEAYTLNYPNPIDKLRRKTGYGIWIYGRGVPITPNLTGGCVCL
jgi:murein L,D-transpeptidase YafK